MIRHAVAVQEIPNDVQMFRLEVFGYLQHQVEGFGVVVGDVAVGNDQDGLK
jgi:hypothetical protein